MQVNYRTYSNQKSFLVKKGRLMKMKIKRYFALEGTTLSCFKSKGEKTPSWTISVKDSTVERNPSNLELTIVLSPEATKTAPRNQNRFVLWAESAKDFEDWCRAIEECSMNDIFRFYEIGPVIGVGSYGKVCEAKLIKTGEVRAVKIMERTGNLEEMEFIRREVEVMQKIYHPNIIRTYDIFDVESKLYIVMEYIGAGDLFEVIAEDENFSEQNAASVMHEILLGVNYLHERNIVHRDIKPENILCTSRSIPFHIKLTDFGFANMLEGDSQMQTMIGTPFYMAPEILRKEGHGPPVDMFACGVVCYAMLSGTLPFESTDDSKNVFEMITEGRVTFPECDWKNVSEAAKKFVTRLLLPDPAQRPTAKEAMEDPWFKNSNAKSMRRLESDLSRLKHIVTKKSTPDNEVLGENQEIRGSQVVRGIAATTTSESSIPEIIDPKSRSGSEGGIIEIHSIDSKDTSESINSE